MNRNDDHTCFTPTQHVGHAIQHGPLTSEARCARVITTGWLAAAFAIHTLRTMIHE